MIFHQDWASLLYIAALIDVLDARVPNSWDGWGGAASWPAPSPNLKPCGILWRGHVGGKVYLSVCSNSTQLKIRIPLYTQSISAKNPQNVWRYPIERRNASIGERGGILKSYNIGRNLNSLGLYCNRNTHILLHFLFATSFWNVWGTFGTPCAQSFILAFTQYFPFSHPTCS